MKQQKSLNKQGHKWHTLVLLAITLICSMSTWFSASAVVPQLKELWNISPSTSAWLTIAVQIGFVIGAMLSSLINLSDLLAPRYVIFIGSVGAAVANVLLSIANGVTLGIALRFVTGFFLAGVYPPAFKLMSTWFRKGRGLALGILAAALVLGNGLPHLVNGLGGLDWKVVIFSTSALTVSSGLIALTIKEGPFPFPTAIFNPREAGQVLTNRGVRFATLGYMGHMWELFAMFAWFSTFIKEALINRGIDMGSLAAFATFGVFIAGSLGSWLGGILSNHLGKIRTTILMMAISGSCSILIGLLFGSPIWLVYSVAVVWGAAAVADSAQYSTLVTELANPSYVGTALTLQLAAGFSITVFTIWLIPLLVETIGWHWAFAFLAPGPALGILSMLKLKSLKNENFVGENKNIQATAENSIQ
jgi:MFS family permease